MYKYLLSLLLIASFASCDKKDEEVEDKSLTMNVRIYDYQPPFSTNRFWTIGLNLNKSVTELGGAIKVKFDVYSAGVFKANHEHIGAFVIRGSDYFDIMTSYNASYAPPVEIKNLVVLDYIQSAGDYQVTITK